jgi:co-chaperonin GroES (HSP10)
MIKALGNRIIVEIVDLDPPKAGSLLLPAQSELETGLVRAWGAEVDNLVENCDVVYFYRDSGTDVKISGHVYRSISADQVLAAWKDE